MYICVYTVCVYRVCVCTYAHTQSLRTKLGFLRDGLRDMLSIHLSRFFKYGHEPAALLPRAPPATESHLHIIFLVLTWPHKS